MGLPKQVLPYRSTTMVGAVVDTAIDAGLAPVIVVTGFHEHAVVVAVGDDALLAHNPNAATGNMSSLLVGLDQVGDAGGVVVLLADMPEVDTEVVVRLADGMSGSSDLAGWVEYSNGRGHPIALARSVFNDVRTLSGPKAIWPFLSSIPEEDAFVVRVDAPRPTDVNTPAEYERITKPSTGD
jgi:molybdenum cofactor cytidylyltransferase